MSMKSKYFKIEEMIRCYKEYGRCEGCRLAHAATKLPYGIEDNAVAQIEDVLEPAREKLGMAIVITSGFRCPLKNSRTAGSSKSSQHQKGQASDLQVSHKGFGSMQEWKRANLELAKVIVRNGKWDQLILENVGRNDLLPAWVHVSYVRGGGNRHQILKKVAGGNGYQVVAVEEFLKG
jgi:hypothetical protein